MHYLSDYEGCVGRPYNQQKIKEENLKLLFQLLRSRREMARADLVRATKLSPTTVSALVDELVRQRLVVEVGYAQTAQTGRKPINLRINASGRQVSCFIMGKDGIRYELYNLGMERLERFELPWNREKDGAKGRTAEVFAARIRETLKENSALYVPGAAAGVCICGPGIYRPDRKAFALPAIDAELNLHVLRELECELGLPLFAGSPSQGLAYAEMQAMERAGVRVNELIYVNAGESVDAGLVAGGDVYTGMDNYAGQLGHISINYRGRPCACGGRGCLEQYVNTRAVLERVAQIAAFKPCRTLDALTGGDMRALTLRMVGMAYDAGEAVILDAVNDVARQLFTGIYGLVCATGVGRVVLGGGIQELGAGFLEYLRALAMRTSGNHLLEGIRFDYSRVRPEDCGAGIVEYFIDRRMEVGKH